MPRSTDPYERALFDNSVERMINTTIRILEEVAPKARGNLKELVEMSLTDWLALKPHVVRCWDETRNVAYAKHNGRVVVIDEDDDPLGDWHGRNE